MNSNHLLYLLVPLAPLAGALLAGFAGGLIGRSGAHWVSIIGVAVSFAASVVIYLGLPTDGSFANYPVYTWLTTGGYTFQVGFLIDKLTVLMMLVVTFVSLFAAPGLSVSLKLLWCRPV